MAYLLRRLPLLAGIVVSALVCVFSLQEIGSEIGHADVVAVKYVAALSLCAIVIFALDSDKIGLGTVDLLCTILFVWFCIAYFISDGYAADIVYTEILLSAVLYCSLRVLFSVGGKSARICLFVVLCLCACYEAIAGLSQALGHSYSRHSLFRITGTFFNPGPYSGYIATVMTMAAAYVFKHYRYVEQIHGGISPRKILWIAVFAVATGAMLLSIMVLPAAMSRAAILGAVISIIMILISCLGNRMALYCRRHAKIAIISAVLVAAISVALCCGAYTLKKDSADGRFLMWKISARIIVGDPVTGVGLGNFSGAYGAEQAEYFKSGFASETEIKVAGCPEYGFNEYLHAGVETGIAGMLLLLATVIAAITVMLRVSSVYAFGLSTLAIFAAFSYPLDVLPLRVLFIILLAVGGSVNRGRKGRCVDKAVAVPVLLCCIAVLPYVYKTLRDKADAMEQWHTVSRWYSMEFYNYVREDYPALMDRMQDNARFMFEYGHALNKDSLYEQSNLILLRGAERSSDPMFYNVIGNNYRALGQWAEAEQAYFRAHYMLPDRVYPLYLLALLYKESGQNQKAVMAARRVVDATPKINSTAVSELKEEMIQLLKELE